MISSIRHQARYNSMELGLILGGNLEKPGKRQNLGVFQGFSRFNFLFLPFSRLFQVFQVTWQPWSYHGAEICMLEPERGDKTRYRSNFYVRDQTTFY